MKPQSGTKVKYGVWGFILGAIITMIIGFSWGGWITAGTSKSVSGNAVLASQSAICVAQFMKQPNYDQALVEIAKLGKWDKGSFIEKGGWDKMPGQEKPDPNVAQSCADGVDLLTKK